MNPGTLVLGLLNGLTIGLLAVGFVLVYKSNRFLNLAHAQLGAVAALFLAKLVVDWGVNFWLAFVVAVAIGAVTGVVVDALLIARVRRQGASPTRLLLLSLGISQLLLALTFVPAFAPDVTDAPAYPQPFATGITVGGVALSGMNVLTAGLAPFLVVAITVFLRVSWWGKQIRAAAVNPEAASLCGISVRRVSTITWALAGALSATSAVLQGPSQQLFNIGVLGPSLLMLTLGAAAFGAFVSLPGALAGGLTLGVTYQVVAGERSSAADAQLAVFVVILLIVLLRGKKIAAAFDVTGAAVEELPRISIPDGLRTIAVVRWQKVWLPGAFLAVGIAAPHLPYFNRASNQFLLTLVLVYSVVAVSLTILMGWGGQVSFGHFAVVGLTAYMTARWSGDHRLLTIVAAAAVMGAVVMVLVGLPALRVRGLTLAVTTLGFAVVSAEWLFLQPRIGTDNPFGARVAPIEIGAGLGTIESEQSVYYLALVVLAIGSAMAVALRRFSPGRSIVAVRDNEVASASFGIFPPAVKLATLATSGGLAGVAGVVWAASWRSVSYSHFTPAVSTALLAIPVIGGLGSIGGAIVAAVALYSTMYFVGPSLDDLFGDGSQNLGLGLFLSGIGSIVVLARYPHGLAGLAQHRWQAYVLRRATTGRLAVGPDAVGPVVDQPTPELTPGRSPVALARPRRHVAPVEGALPLEIRGITLAFGGIQALDGPDIDVRAAEIVGLMGTNGAGKTTLMNVISGIHRPDSGSVRVFGRDVVGVAPDLRASLGLARSFQDARLFAGLTVRETIQTALARTDKISFPAAMTVAPWARASERRLRHRAAEVLDRFGLGPWADARTIDLSTGTRRICDLAAQVATQPKIILLDEPTAGVAQREAEAFGPLVRQIRDELDCSILIIEHDMPLLMGLCDRAYALESGKVIAEGSPDELRTNPRVVASYLGTDEVAITRSGDEASGQRRSAPLRASTGPPAEPASEPLLRADHVNFSYGQVQVLFDVSLDVGRGEALALLGTNGAGKSTLLKAIAGLAAPSSGTIWFDGADVTRMSPDRLASEGLTLISGGRSTYGDMTVDENLEIQAAGIRDDPALVRTRMDEVFDTFPRLRERRDRHAGSLSGGEQQQLALARALLLDPPFLCIDELSLGLAPVVVGELIAVVRRLRERGTTLVLVEQSLNIAAQLCDRAVFLEKGSIRFEGKTQDLLERDDLARAVFLGEMRDA